MASSYQSARAPMAMFAYSDGHGGPQSARWELRITFGQLFAFWFLLALAMVTIFVFGFHRGRSQGLALAFEEYGEQTVRLPIVQPVPPAASAAAPAAAEPAAAKAQPDQQEKEQAFDFSGTKTPGADFEQKSPEAAVSPEVTPTMKSKAELELLAGAAKSEVKPQAEASTAQKRLAFLEKSKRSEIPLKIETKPTAALQKGWYIQAAAAGSQDEASNIVRPYDKGGYPTILEKAQVRDKTYYRVLVGPYEKRDNAVIVKDDLVKNKLSTGTPFIKFVNP